MTSQTRRTPYTRIHRPRASRLDRVNISIASALKAMRSGAALHLDHTPKGPPWQLSNGPRLTADVARVVVANPDVVAVDHALFRNTKAQTWRFAWIDESESEDALKQHRRNR